MLFVIMPVYISEFGQQFAAASTLCTWTCSWGDEFNYDPVAKVLQYVVCVQNIVLFQREIIQQTETVTYIEYH